MNKLSRKLLIATACLVGALAWTSAIAEEESAPNQAVAIVVHDGTNVDDVSLDQLRRIFLAEQQFWPDRSRITLLVRAPGAYEREFVLERIPERAAVLELGCGYGRVLEPLLARSGSLMGIDTSRQSLAMASESLGHQPHLHLVAMDAAAAA